MYRTKASIHTTTCALHTLGAARGYISTTSIRLSDNKNNNDGTSVGKDSEHAPSSSAATSSSHGRLPPSWTRGDLGRPRQRRDPVRDLTHGDIGVYDKDVDGPIENSNMPTSDSRQPYDLKTGGRVPSNLNGSERTSHQPRRPPARPGSEEKFSGDSEHFSSFEGIKSRESRSVNSESSFSDASSSSSAEELPAHSQNYHSEHTQADIEYFETSGSSARKAMEMASFTATGQPRSARLRSGIGSGYQTNRVGDYKSKFQQYAHRGYDWLERLAKKGPHSSDRDLRLNIIIIAIVIVTTIVFSYWLLCYRTVVLTTNAYRKEITRLPKLPTDFVYLQSKWPWCLVKFPWSNADRSLLVVREISNGDNLYPAAEQNNNEASEDVSNLSTDVSISVNPLFISSRLYRNPRDCVVQVHPDPISGRHVEKRVRYNKMFYNAIPYLFERELPYVVNLASFVDPFMFQREGRTAKRSDASEVLSPSGLPDSYPATKQPPVLGKHDVDTAQKKSSVPNILFKFRMRLKRDAASHVGALPFVEAVIDESAKVIFTKYYYDAIIRNHQEKTAARSSDLMGTNDMLIQRMIYSGTVNGQDVTFEKIFEGGRAQQFVNEVLNEVVLRVADNAIILEKNARLV